MVALAYSGLVIRAWVMTSPVIGDDAGSPSRANVLSGTPSRDKIASASLRTDVCWTDETLIIAYASEMVLRTDLRLAKRCRPESAWAGLKPAPTAGLTARTRTASCDCASHEAQVSSS